MESSQTQTGTDHPIVLFDGVCNFCNGWVRFIVARDPQARLRLAAVQSPAGQEILERSGLPLDNFDTMVLVEDGTTYFKSTAFLRAVRYLKQPWPWLTAGRLVPRPVRDWLYDRIARNRYRLFGRTESCMIPTPEMRSRFL